MQRYREEDILNFDFESKERPIKESKILVINNDLFEFKSRGFIIESRNAERFGWQREMKAWVVFFSISNENGGSMDSNFLGIENCREEKKLKKDNKKKKSGKLKSYLNPK